MRCRSTAAMLVLLGACQREPGVSVRLVTEPGVPALSRVHLATLQGGELLMQDKEDLPLGALALPQTVVLTSWNRAEGPVAVIAQGFNGGVVEARGEVSTTFTRDAPYREVTLLLLRLCEGGKCGLMPTTCAAQKIQCGVIDDQAGGFLRCGECPEGQTCGAGGAGRCGTGACMPTASCASLDAGCGVVSDGCKLVPCGNCSGQNVCAADHTCACSPALACATADAGCRPVADGCGRTITCESCTAPQTCGGGADPDHCGCSPRCDTKVCGADDGCGGKCLTGACPAASQCVAGTCQCENGGAACGMQTQCVDLTSDALNCGACNHKCPRFDGCQNGVCVCSDPKDNGDGHCCPVNWSFEYSADMRGPYCFNRAAGVTDLLGAELSCSLQNACVGFGPVLVGAPAPIPASASCGSYLAGRSGMFTVNPLVPWVETYVDYGQGLTELGGQSCSACDGGDTCTCKDCVCAAPATGCSQTAYCVKDPLAPRRSPCLTTADCPGGTSCDGGACLADPSFGCCVSDFTCNANNSGTCQRVGDRATGLCH